MFQTIGSTESTEVASAGRGRSQRTRSRDSSPLAAAIRAAYASRLTQTELASVLGVAQNTISRWSTGEVEPRLDDIAAIEDACGLSRGHILRAAGFVATVANPEDAVAADHRLDPARRELLVAAYRAALAQCASSAVAAAP
ncbi:MAG: helix-turn-helix protein [Actinomycetota bacterium]|jgi:transcriptional regulator with XRE-family HTH domain